MATTTTNSVYINLATRLPINGFEGLLLETAKAGKFDSQHKPLLGDDGKIHNRRLRNLILQHTEGFMSTLPVDHYPVPLYSHVSINQYRALCRALSGKVDRISISCYSLLILRSVFILLAQNGCTEFGELVEIANIIKSAVDDFYSGDENELPTRFLLACYEPLIAELEASKPADNASFLYPHLVKAE